MYIAAVEPFFSGSHRSWLEQLCAHSSFDFEILGLEPQFWKWRMQSGDLELRSRFHSLETKPDLLLASDMLDLASFLSGLGEQTPSLLYFHENQLSYPWSAKERNAEHFKRSLGLINIKSALAATHCAFNSEFHRSSFLQSVDEFLNEIPGFEDYGISAEIKQKSSVLHLGLELPEPSQNSIKGDKLRILWNHRWEWDKDPQSFFSLLFELSDESIDFELVVLGEENDTELEIFTAARERLARHIVHFGYAGSKTEYLELAASCDILPVCSKQEFFGASVAEAAALGVFPLLPKRLSYPEVFSIADFPQHFYSNVSDLKTHLSSMLRSKEVPVPQGLSRFVQRYSWTNMLPKYEELLKTLTRSRKDGV